MTSLRNLRFALFAMACSGIAERNQIVNGILILNGNIGAQVRGNILQTGSITISGVLGSPRTQPEDNSSTGNLVIGGTAGPPANILVRGNTFGGATQVHNRVRGGGARGINLDVNSSDNIWRNNVLRNNTAAVTNSGANHLDAGNSF